MTITITTESEKILEDAKVLKVKAGFLDIGIDKFPTSLIAGYCPEKQAVNISKWMNRASMIWHGRVRNQEFTAMFEKSLKNAKLKK